jgi:hypothetical protein
MLEDLAEKIKALEAETRALPPFIRRLFDQWQEEQALKMLLSCDLTTRVSFAQRLVEHTSWTVTPR